MCAGAGNTPDPNRATFSKKRSAFRTNRFFYTCSCRLLGMLVMFSVRQSEKFVSNDFTQHTLLLFLHLRCRGGPSDLQFRLGLAQLPDLHHLLGLVRAELWAKLQLGLGLNLRNYQHQDGGATLALIRRRAELRVQSAGIVLRAPQLMVAGQREHD